MTGAQALTEQRITYNDGVVRRFIAASVIFGIVGMTVGVLIALQLAFPVLNLDLPWTSFGRLRPLHTNAAIFAFVGNMVFAGIYYSSQRLLKTRLAAETLANIHFYGWQLLIVAAAVAVTAAVGPARRSRQARLKGTWAPRWRSSASSSRKAP